MIQHLSGIYNRYVPSVLPPDDAGTAWWFIFHSGKLLVKTDGENISIPLFENPENPDVLIVRKQYLGTLDGHHCFSAEAAADICTDDYMSFKEFRSLFGTLEDDVFLLAGRAMQIVNWDRTHQFCGRCGSMTDTKPDERAKVCPKCGLTTYPRISPAVITAVIRDNRILLAHAKHFRENMYSVIAGFVEPGETLEDCVKREVQEEVGISVRNIRYFASQPWPFPDSLMIGFIADYAGGEIKVDGVEISHAGWYESCSLPEIPSRMSIARRLIDWFVEKYK